MEHFSFVLSVYFVGLKGATGSNIKIYLLHFFSALQAAQCLVGLARTGRSTRLTRIRKNNSQLDLSCLVNIFDSTELATYLMFNVLDDHLDLYFPSKGLPFFEFIDKSKLSNSYSGTITLETTISAATHRNHPPVYGIKDILGNICERRL